jgi:DNA-binding MarR family transcriptional regulator
MAAALDPHQVDELRLALIRLERKLRKSAGSGGVTPSQYSALFALDRHGPFRLGELGRREQIGKSTVTRLVAGLEVRGLVTRAEDHNDARSSIVGITAEGRALLAQLARGSNDYLRQRLEGLEDAELARLRDAIGALTRLAERA